VQRETEGAAHVLIPDPEAMYVVTEDNVYLRRIDLSSGAIDWDLEIGQNEKGNVYTSYATAFSETHLGQVLAVGVYDERVDIIDLKSGERVSQIWLHQDGRSRIVSLDWFPGGGMLAIGLATGTVLFAWLPDSFDTPWRLRVFRAADRALRKIQFHPFGDRLLTLSQDGFLRSWTLLDDERARMLTP
jgi:WD40 repeat protein